MQGLAIENYSGSTRTERDRWIAAQRGARAVVDETKPYGFFVEKECSSDGEIVPVATVLLTNRECPWRCAMCDLWKHTLTELVKPGSILAQINYALSRLPEARQIKLYNSGSFFDARAIPPGDWAGIAQRLRSFERVIVESHPLLVTKEVLRLRDLLPGRLEVAMGLETVHPQVLQQLNKGMTLDEFALAAASLRENEIDLRSFILVQPPFMEEGEALHWAKRSLDFAFDCGATAATLIATRGGNGAMEMLEQARLFSPPNLETLELALDYGVGLKRGRVFADLWDLKPGNLKLVGNTCLACFGAKLDRLRTINLRQVELPPITCQHLFQQHERTARGAIT